MDGCKKEIKLNKFIYSAFGRKRRLHNVNSTDRGVAASEVRSGFNAIIQGVSSDINILGAMDTHNMLNTTHKHIDAKICMLVHDSIVAIVKDEDIAAYSELLGSNVQKDRGVSIPGAPVGLDFDIHQDYSVGKYAKQYPELA
jgi:DNA polymerase I-like protein with 3'-5' exonuclease and polymerase domains